MLFTTMIVFHTLVCILLVIVVLMQSAKGEGLAGAFGGGGGSGLSGAVFGGRGAASFLSKATTVLAVVFMLNCGTLAYMSANRTGGGTGDVTDSAVTREAQKEMERQAAQQQAIPPIEGEGGGQLPAADGGTAPSETPTQTEQPASEGSGN